MKNIKALLGITLSLIICLGLCACGGNSEDGSTNTNTDMSYESNEEAGLSEIEGKKLTEENIIGTGWQCTYYDGEDKIYTRFILSAEKEYKQIFAINGLYSHNENGTYEVKGGKLHLYINGDTASATVYEYKHGNLLNSGNEFEPYFE